MSWATLDKAAAMFSFISACGCVVPKLYNEMSIEGSLDKVKKIIETCESLLADLKMADPLLGMLVESQYPGFIRQFEGDLRVVKIHYSSCTCEASELSCWKNPIQWHALHRAVKDLYDTASSVHKARATTSNRVGKSPLYTELHNEFYSKKLSEEELLAKLRCSERAPPPQLPLLRIGTALSTSPRGSIATTGTPSDGLSSQV